MSRICEECRPLEEIVKEIFSELEEYKKIIKKEDQKCITEEKDLKDI